MFGLSTWEILIILAVALIFVGPDQLPKVARQIGKGVRQVRGAMGKVDDEMRRAMREAAAELDDEGQPVVPPRPAPPPIAPPPTDEPPRDWSQVGKAAVPGRVASATPGRPAVSVADANAPIPPAADANAPVPPMADATPPVPPDPNAMVPPPSDPTPPTT